MAALSGRVFVYGGKGALGSVVVSYFKSRNWWVGSIDLKNNDEAHANVIVKPEIPLIEQEDEVVSGVKQVLDQEKVDALICVAGGWLGGNATSKDFITNSEAVWKQSVWSSLITAKLASMYLKENGLVCLTGAKAALEATPGMIGYGMAKASVHQLVHSLASPKSGMPENALVLAILPITLDTPMNRKFMPSADISTWTPLEYVAELLHKWSSKLERPKNGSLVQLITKNSETELELI